MKITSKTGIGGLIIITVMRAGRAGRAPLIELIVYMGFSSCALTARRARSRDNDDGIGIVRLAGIALG